MEQFNIYKDGVKVSTTDDTTFDFSDLQSNTRYKLGVSRVVDGRESEVVTVSASTKEHIPQTPDVTDREEPIVYDIDEYHTGAGWYELPNGEKVRGKDNAIETLENLLDE